MNQERRKTYRYFLLSFSIAFLVLSLLFFLLMNAVHPKEPDLTDTEPALGEASSYFPGREEALTVLFVGIGPDGTEGETFILARFDPARGKVPIITLPPETAVRNNERIETLAEVYRYGGADYSRRALAQTLNIDIDRYVRMDIPTFLVAAATVGTVEYNLPQEMVLDNGGAVSITMSPGKQLLDGQRIVEIFRYEKYEGGNLARCRNVSALTAEIVNQRMDIALSTVVDKVFEKLINLIDTDISYADYDDRKQAARFLARMGEDVAQPMEVNGSYNEDKTLYTLSDTFAALLTQTFS